MVKKIIPSTQLLLEIELYPSILFSTKLGYLWNICYAHDFSSQGYVDIQYKDILEYVGISRATIYRHISEVLNPESYPLFSNPVENIGKGVFRFHYVRDFSEIYKRSVEIDPERYQNVTEEYFISEITRYSGVGTHNYLKREYRDNLYISSVIAEKNKSIVHGHNFHNCEDIKRGKVPKITSASTLFTEKFQQFDGEKPFQKHKGVTTTKRSVYVRPTYGKVPNFSYKALVPSLEENFKMLGDYKYRRFNNITVSTIGNLCRKYIKRKIVLEKCGELISDKDPRDSNPSLVVFNNEIYKRVGSVFEPVIPNFKKGKVEQPSELWKETIFPPKNIATIDEICKELADAKKQRAKYRNENSKLETSKILVTASGDLISDESVEIDTLIVNGCNMNTNDDNFNQDDFEESKLNFDIEEGDEDEELIVLNKNYNFVIPTPARPYDPSRFRLYNPEDGKMYSMDEL